MPGDASRNNGIKGGRPRGSVSAATRVRQRARDRALKQEDITAERTMLEIARIAFADRRNVWDKDGNLKPLSQWTEAEAACLEGFEAIIKNAKAGDGHMDTVHKVKLTNKIAALEILAKHFSLMTEKLEVSGKLTLEDLIVASRE